MRAAYKKRALETHPDKGGDADTFREIRQAYERVTRTPAGPQSAPEARQPPAKTAQGMPQAPQASQAQQGPRREAQGTKWEPQWRWTSQPASPTGGLDAPRVSLAAQVSSRKRKTMTEEINMAFKFIPTSEEPQNESSATASAASRMPPASASQVPAAPAAPGKLRRASAKQKGSKDDSQIAGLWAQMTQLSPEKREKALNALKGPLKEKLRNFLAARRSARNEQPGSTSTPGDGSGQGRQDLDEEASSCSSSSASGSDSSSSSSDDSGDETEEAAGNASASASAAASSSGLDDSASAQKPPAVGAAKHVPGAATASGSPAVPTSVPTPTVPAQRPGGLKAPGQAAVVSTGAAAIPDISVLAARICSTPRADRRTLLEALPQATRNALERYLQAKHSGRAAGASERRTPRAKAAA